MDIEVEPLATELPIRPTMVLGGILKEDEEWWRGRGLGLLRGSRGEMSLGGVRRASMGFRICCLGNALHEVVMEVIGVLEKQAGHSFSMIRVGRSIQLLPVVGRGCPRKMCFSF